jgi:hypothetical protein
MTSPAQPRTSTALWLRSLTIKLVRQWQTLTATQRADWNTYATDHPQIDWTGISKRVTGANWFVGLNTRLLYINKTAVLTPPTTAAPDPPQALTATAATGKVTVTWTPMTGTKKSLIFYVYGPHSKGLWPKFPKAKFFAVLAGEAGTYDVLCSQTGRFTIWVCTCDEDNGLISTWQSVYADVTTLS